ncbi:PLP-dependent lyase/thiolase [Patescibacteria group bacterium]|nr:PLP-dependent lyase/thiolase [Patescibacteria group bacterium]MCG2701727.1 PLP-dependent lyase/thiolase [Candidatus Parcubacteria bacterium]MBU4264632.1 PLP-dependent lyase/thiolase [Patescibacteria group bacterium]MBU4390587.1 PLP-dependent lyase/thiolase [Patescibacteria group bacterium]MBU4397471.1 PLP-dependent lyase/thiolase [Patescibacteria group bacterium]
MTPLIKINNFYLKREDLNITGSAKDRAMASQIQNLKKKGFKKAVISSTGNAAISAIHFCQKNNLSLTIFLSPKINQNKLKLIKKSSTNIIITPKPISQAFKYAKQNNAYFLRQSTDPSAISGYKKIGKEIMSQLPQITSLFAPVGSGTTLFAISQSIPDSIKLFAIQPASHTPIASVFDKNFYKETKSSTNSLSAKFLPLKNKLIKAIKKTKGSGLVIQEKQLQIAKKILQKQQIFTSAEGYLTLAGFLKTKNKCQPGDYPVILLTGTNR